MKLSLVGRWSMALFASLALGLGMTACGGGTIGYMWVLGQQYNEVIGYKVDGYSGNLTEVLGSPFSSNGSVPVSIVIKAGGRYVYVINQGVGGSAAGAGTGQTIALYSVGGDGTLAFQQSYQTQGYVSEWAQMDSSGTYLYVLDKYSPGYIAPGTVGYPAQGGYIGPNTDPNPSGAITAFVADAATGRLTLITNSQTQLNGVNTPFWSVGPSPIMSKTMSTCLYTVNSGFTNGTQSITPFQIGTGGQLMFTTTGNIAIGTTTGTPTNITSINGNSSYAFLTDYANNVLYGYASTGACNLTALSGGTTANLTGTSHPVNSMLDSTGQYLFVLNNSTNSTSPTTPYSSISSFFFNPSNHELQPVTGAPFTVGSGPTCMVEDPSNQYVYTSNYTAGTITGKSLRPNSGELSDLPKGSTFPGTGKASCLAVSGSVE